MQAAGFREAPHQSERSAAPSPAPSRTAPFPPLAHLAVRARLLAPPRRPALGPASARGARGAARGARPRPPCAHPAGRQRPLLRRAALRAEGGARAAAVGGGGKGGGRVPRASVRERRLSPAAAGGEGRSDVCVRSGPCGAPADAGENGSGRLEGRARFRPSSRFAACLCNGSSEAPQCPRPVPRVPLLSRSALRPSVSFDPALRGSLGAAVPERRFRRPLGVARGAGGSFSPERSSVPAAGGTAQLAVSS